MTGLPDDLRKQIREHLATIPKPKRFTMSGEPIVEETALEKLDLGFLDLEKK